MQSTAKQYVYIVISPAYYMYMIHNKMYNITAIHNAIKTIQPDVTIDRKTATKLSKNLGICMSEMSSGDLTVVSICERWRQQNSTGKIDHLTRALLSTRGLGRLVSGFCPPSKL